MNPGYRQPDRHFFELFAIARQNAEYRIVFCPESRRLNFQQQRFARFGGEVEQVDVAGLVDATVENDPRLRGHSFRFNGIR